MAEKNYGEYPDDVQNFLKRLETSLEIGDEENAMQLAKQLAKWRIKCNIEIRQNYAENNTGSNFSRSRALDECKFKFHLAVKCVPNRGLAIRKNREALMAMTH